MRHIALLGSTGSIGRNTVEVIRANRERFQLTGMAAGENIEEAVRQIREFSPKVVAVKHQPDAETLRELFPDIPIYYGPEGLLEVVAHPEVNVMVSAIDGTTALEATLEAIQRNQRICLANKETLVAAGELINRRLDDSNAELIPIDSEQSAIFQSIGLNHKAYIRKIILTASGGPFFKRTLAAPDDPFAGIAINDALAHPTWNMGRKITIDSATLMNKALEIIEAFYLFRIDRKRIAVVIHPQSIIHSMVEYIDSSIIAQLSSPDMKLPILYSLSYPERIEFNQSRFDFLQFHKLEFHPVDMQVFTSLKMAFDVLEHGKSAGAVLNAANEIAVDYFLREKISFKDIFRLAEEVFYRETFHELASLTDIQECIRETKIKTVAAAEHFTRRYV